MPNPFFRKCHPFQKIKGGSLRPLKIGPCDPEIAEFSLVFFPIHFRILHISHRRAFP